MLDLMVEMYTNLTKIANETVQENLTTSFYYIKPNNSSQRYIPGEPIYGEYGLLGEFGSMQQDVVADYNYSPSYIEEGQEIYFTDESYSFGENIISWSWDFGDGATSNEQNPSHSYSQEGTYCVSLTVTDNNGNSSGIMRFIVVSENNGNQGSGQQGSGGGQNS